MNSSPQPSGFTRTTHAAKQWFIPRQRRFHRPSRGLWIVLAIGLLPAALGVRADEPPTAAGYEFRAEHSPDGIGKFFLGREIAHVMGHQGAWWLERPEREQEEHPVTVINALNLQTGHTVADLGSGTGYFTRRLAEAVGPSGKVYAVDIQAEMLELLERRMQAADIKNVTPVLATERDPNLPPNSLDLLLMVDVYHELAFPREVMAQVLQALKPGGRVAFVEYRAEDPKVPIKPLHKMAEAQVRKEATAHGLEWIETIDTLPRQHLVLCRKPAQPTPLKD